jgi:GTP-binding protein HflX
MVEEELLVPYDLEGCIGEIRRSAHIVEEKYDEKGVRVRIKADSGTLTRLKKRITG